MNNNATSTQDTLINVLIQVVNEGIIIIDLNGRITAFNHGAERITGWSCVDVLSTQVHKVLNYSNNKESFLEGLPADGNRYQRSIKNKDGKPVHVMVRVFPWLLSGNNQPGTLIVISERQEKELFENLQKRLLNDITQEFLTPLATLNASVEFFLDEIDQLSSDQIIELSNAMNISVKELQTLIENILESSNIEAGSFFIRLQPIELQKIIQEAIKIVKPILERRSQVVRVRWNDHYPLVRGDSARLTHVLVNLLLNASKFGPVNQEITLAIEREDLDMLRVSVADQGSGVPIRDQGKIFDRFMRSGPKNGVQRGIGLGLSVVRSIVHEHGGEVGFDFSHSGGGIFWFTIQSKIQE